MEEAAAGANQAAFLHPGGVCREHAQPRGLHHPGHEHRPALHEGAGEQDARWAEGDDGDDDDDDDDDEDEEEEE